MTDKKSNDRRRKLLKSIAVGSGAVVAGKSLPESWTKPVIDSVMLPVHAKTSQSCTDTFVDFTKNDSWVVPAGVTEITVTAVGGSGGGGGGGCSRRYDVGGNGGIGALGQQQIEVVGVTSGDTLDIIIGLFGTAGGGGSVGISGGGAQGLGGSPDGVNGNAGTVDDRTGSGGGGGSGGSTTVKRAAIILASAQGGTGGGGGGGARSNSSFVTADNGQNGTDGGLGGAGAGSANNATGGNGGLVATGNGNDVAAAGGAGFNNPPNAIPPSSNEGSGTAGSTGSNGRVQIAYCLA